ncbi:MAG: hypothetical protein AB8H86_18820 [Polyangiales bacterium]
MGRWCCLCFLGFLWVIQSGAAFAQAPAREEPGVSATDAAAPADAPEHPSADEAPAADVVEEGLDEEVVTPLPPEVAVTPAVPSPESPESSESPQEPESPESPESPQEPLSTVLEFSLRADQAGRLRFESEGAEAQEFPAPGRAALEPAAYRVTWTPSEGAPELLDAGWRPNGEPLRVAHRGPSFMNLMGYWLLGNGLLVGVPVSLGVFAKRDDLGAAATFSIIGVNTLVAIAGAIFMGVGDDEVIELEQN